MRPLPTPLLLLHLVRTACHVTSPGQSDPWAGIVPPGLRDSALFSTTFTSVFLGSFFAFPYEL